MISYQNSKKILSNAIIRIQDENIKSMNSLNRVLSENIYSKMNYPSGNNAAFDGYAINSKDTKQIKKRLPQYFKIIGSLAAGAKPFKKKIDKFNAVMISTALNLSILFLNGLAPAAREPIILKYWGNFFLICLVSLEFIA